MSIADSQGNWAEKNYKRVLVGTAIAVLLWFILLILGEIGARIFIPSWAPERGERVKFWIYDNVLGWAHEAGKKGDFKHRDFSVEVAINSQGLRDKEYSLKRSSKMRMLILGDSLGWGFGVEHHEIFSEIFEADHPEWEIINASVSGYGTGQQFLYLKDRGMRYAPDVVLLLFHPNDFGNNLKKEEYWYYKPHFALQDGKLEVKNLPVPRSTPGQLFYRHVYGNMYLVPRLHHRFHNGVRRIISSLVAPEEAPKILRDAYDKETYEKEDKYHITVSLLTEINNLSRKAGAQFLIVSVPMKTELKERLEILSEREKIPYLHLDEVFSGIKEKVTFAHDEHWNSKGHEVAAKAIEQYLIDIGIF